MSRLRTSRSKMKLRKGDRVQVLQGKDRGKSGEIMRVLPKQGKVIVEGVNVAKKHQKATRATMQGGIIDKDMPIAGRPRWPSSAGTDGPTRIGYRIERRRPQGPHLPQVRSRAVMRHAPPRRPRPPAPG